MRVIPLTRFATGADHIRRIQAHGTTLAVLVGDERHTHTVHWLRLPDRAELRRVEVSVGDRVPDLTTLAYAAIGEAARISSWKPTGRAAHHPVPRRDRGGPGPTPAPASRSAEAATCSGPRSATVPLSGGTSAGRHRPSLT